mmetsp:Transcript_269/g.259  ORF Transcript_269/g.259 Transcript_269/m.259 type:complete len:88 (+) Transcript_269:447-710(+)
MVLPSLKKRRMYPLSSSSHKNHEKFRIMAYNQKACKNMSNLDFLPDVECIDASSVYRRNSHVSVHHNPKLCKSEMEGSFQISPMPSF